MQRVLSRSCRRAPLPVAAHTTAATPASPTARSNSAVRRSSESFVTERCRSGSLQLEEALSFFDALTDMAPPPSIRTFGSLFSALQRMQQHAVVVSLYNRMARRGLGGVFPSSYICSIVTNCCCELGRVDVGLGIYGRTLKLGVASDTAFFTALVKGLCTEGRVADAVLVFERMPGMGCPWNDWTCGTLVKGLCGAGRPSLALRLSSPISVPGKSLQA